MTTTDHDLETGWRPDTPVGDTLLRRYVCNLAASWEAAATAMGQRTLRPDEFVAADHARPTGLFNSVTLTLPLLGEDLHARLDDIEAFYASGTGHVQLWSPWPTSDLTDRGWQLEGHPPMLLRPASSAPCSSTTGSVTSSSRSHCRRPAAAATTAQCRGDACCRRQTCRWPSKSAL